MNTTICKKFLFWLQGTIAKFNKYPIHSLPLHLIEECDLQDYRIHLINQIKKGILSERTTSSRLYIVRALFSTLYQTGRLTKDISIHIQSIPFEKYYYRQIPNDTELNQFFKTIDCYSADPIKEKPAFALMLLVGFRICEVERLRWEDINFSNDSINVQGKGDKPGLLPLPFDLNDLLQSMKDSTSTGPLFSKKFLKDLYFNFKIYSLIAGWKIETSPCILRHIFITRLSKKRDCPPQVLMALSRHDRPENTSLYIHRNETELSATVNKIKYD